ncbi:hypothetical protein ACOSQ4_013939 [Xanthoceras sorbifolium]
MENPTASQTTSSSTCAQNLLLSLRNLQLNDDGIWADNNGGVSMYKINLSSSSSSFGRIRIFVLVARIAYKIFNVVYGFLFRFMNDQFARHVFVKIITSCNYYHLQLITQKIASQSEQELFLMTSFDKHGASSIKKLIKVLSISKLTLICYVISALSRLFEDIMITKSDLSRLSTYLCHPQHCPRKPKDSAPFKYLQHQSSRLQSEKLSNNLDQESCHVPHTLTSNSEDKRFETNWLQFSS